MTRATIIVPRGAEAAAVRRGARGARIVELPAGATAARALPTFEPDELVVVMGLCGALRDLGVGDVVIYRRIKEGAQAFALDTPTAEVFSAWIPAARIVDACVTGHVVTTLSERRALAERYDADVVDMEASRLAEALATHGVRFAMIRVVSDDATRELPALQDAIGADGSIRPVRIALAFARRPRAAFAFVRDVRRALRVLSDLAGAISRT